MTFHKQDSLKDLKDLKDTEAFLTRMKNRMFEILPPTTPKKAVNTVDAKVEGRMHAKATSTELSIEEENLAQDACVVVKHISTLKTNKSEYFADYFESLVESEAAHHVHGSHAKTKHPPEDHRVALMSQIVLLRMDEKNHDVGHVADTLHSRGYETKGYKHHEWASRSGGWAKAFAHHHRHHHHRKHPKASTKHAETSSWVMAPLFMALAVGITLFKISSDSSPGASQSPTHQPKL